MEEILNEVDILAIFVSMSWFGFQFWFWIFWIYAWTCAIVLLILCLRLNGFVFLSLCFCVPWMDLVLDLGWFCWMRGDSWVCILIFWSTLCLYCQCVVLDFEFPRCVCIVSMLCLILNFLGLFFILNFFCLNFECFGGKNPKIIFFFFFKNL